MAVTMSSTAAFLFYVLTMAYANAQLQCNRGQYLVIDETGGESCHPCPEGTYYPRDGHRNLDCARCDKALPQRMERLLEPCNATSNAILGCEPGFYRENTYHTLQIITLVTGYCIPCKSCQDDGMVEVVPCGHFTNTFCCPTAEGVEYQFSRSHLEVRCRSYR